MSLDMWAAVDRITKPTRAGLLRDTTLGDDIANPEDLWTRGSAFCDIATYRAATAPRALIPSLWEQATHALYRGNRAGSEGKSQSSNVRTPADIDLMEWLATIREFVAHEIRLRPKLAKSGSVPEQLRRLAADITGDPAEKPNLWWWEYRFESYARTLANYVQAAQVQPRTVRLRNSACPDCDARQTVIEDEGGEVVVPVLVIDFNNGYVRAAECLACGRVWFRDELTELATRLSA